MSLWRLNRLHLIPEEKIATKGNPLDSSSGAVNMR